LPSLFFAFSPFRFFAIRPPIAVHDLLVAQQLLQFPPKHPRRQISLPGACSAENAPSPEPGQKQETPSAGAAKVATVRDASSNFDKARDRNSNTELAIHNKDEKGPFLHQ
jgi:hypothetical protein